MGSYYIRIVTAYGSIVRAIAVTIRTLRARGFAIAVAYCANVGTINGDNRAANK